MATIAHYDASRLVQLTYCSRSRLTGRPDQIDQHIREILLVCRRNNAADGITGALLYDGKGFAQVLEGSLAAVAHRFDRIVADTRHTDVVELSREFIPRRLFSAWSMAYADSASLRMLPNSEVDLETILLAGKSRSGFVLNLLRDVMAATA